MIIVQLQGGHSNQLFQYAAARKLAEQYGTGLKIDLSWYKDVAKYDSPRQYELGSYNIIEEQFKPVSIDALKLRIGLIQKYNEPRYAYDPKLETLGKNLYLHGDFQSEKYFSSIRSIILKELSYKKGPSVAGKKLLDRIQKDPAAVSLHIRRGDYASHKTVNAIHGLKDITYYESALTVIKKKIKNPTVYVISNDPKWCKENLRLDAKLVIVDINDDISGGAEDMRLMRACKHNILANSSFSWWGAWLNENPDKIVIAPKVWFNDESIDTTDLIPADWVRL